MTQNDNENRLSVRFAESVDPDDTVTLTKTVEEAATVDRLDVRIYRGAELDLHVQPFVKRDGRRFDLVQWFGKGFIDGDADHWQFPVSEAVEKDDVIGVDVEHVGDEFTLDFAADFVLDRAGGSSRAGGLLDSLMGWL